MISNKLVYPAFYQPARYKNLLNNKSVFGFHVPDAVWRTGYYRQEIRIGDKVWHFAYQKIDRRAFFKMFSLYTGRRMSRFLDDMIDRMADELGVTGLDSFSSLGEPINASAEWVGSGYEKSGDYSFIKAPEGRELVYLRNAGRPTLNPALITYLKPLGFFE